MQFLCTISSTVVCMCAIYVHVTGSIDERSGVVGFALAGDDEG